MRKIHMRCAALSSLLLFGLSALAQEPWTWQRVRARFEQNNPTLQAGKLTIDESKTTASQLNLTVGREVMQ